MQRRPPHILLAEADGLLAELVAFRLELLGYTVTRVETGTQLFALVHEVRLDLVLLDSHQPDGDGLELVNRLTSDQETKNLPILVFSIVGEQTRKLAQTARYVSDHLQRQIERKTDVMVGTIEPVLTIGPATAIGFVLLAIYLPMFDMINVIGTK